MGLKFYLAYFFPVKPQVCNAGANCSNPNFILCKIVFVFLVNETETGINCGKIDRI